MTLSPDAQLQSPLRMFAGTWLNTAGTRALVYSGSPALNSANVAVFRRNIQCILVTPILQVG